MVARWEDAEGEKVEGHPTGPKRILLVPAPGRLVGSRVSRYNGRLLPERSDP